MQDYPCSFDTYLAARKFYPWLDDFRLKTLAPFLNVIVENRLYLAPSQIKLDDRTMIYNKQDVQEQIGVTLNLISQALPLSFTTCMPFDMLLSSGAVNMWDHMALLRGALHKKIIPPICRVKSVSQVLVKDFGTQTTKEDIIRQAKKRRDQLSKDIIRVLKYTRRNKYSLKPLGPEILERKIRTERGIQLEFDTHSKKVTDFFI